jgi:hypothetical protein
MMRFYLIVVAVIVVVVDLLDNSLIELDHNKHMDLFELLKN